MERPFVCSVYLYMLVSTIDSFILPACLPAMRVVFVLVRSTESGPLMSCTHKPERDVKNKTQSKAGKKKRGASKTRNVCRGPFLIASFRPFTYWALVLRPRAARWVLRYDI